MSELVKLICPKCRTDLVLDAAGASCETCKSTYPYRQGVLSFLESDASFNPTSFKDKQESAWSTSARLRERIRSSRFLSFLNTARIKFSMSGRRDRIFYDEMHGGDPGRLILDVGCGGGRHYFADYGKVVGIDPVLELLGIAKTMYLEVYHASAFELPFADNTFDYVVSSDVIGHIPGDLKDRMFSEMHRVLKPGGRTVHMIETDATNLWFRFAHRFPDLFREYFVDRPGHVSLELPSQLQLRFLRQGFKQIRFRSYATNIQDCGWYCGLFNNEFKRKSSLVRFVVGVDRMVSKNLLVKEIINFLLEPAAQVVDHLVPLDHASGAMVVFEKIRVEG